MNTVANESSPVENLGVDGLVLEVDEVHLLPDLLERGLAAERRQVRTHVAVSLRRNLHS